MVDYSERAEEYGGPEPSDYEIVRDAVIEHLNPADDDAAEPAIIEAAIEAAAEFIAERPCLCTPDDIEDHDPCRRCAVLGRLGGRRVER